MVWRVLVAAAAVTCASAELKRRGPDAVTPKPGALALVNARVAAIQKQLELTKRRSEEAVTQLRADYKEKLEAQTAENAKVEAVNSQLVKEIDAFKKYNVFLRNRTEFILERSQNHIAHAYEMKENLTQFDKFFQDVLALQNATLQAPELEILAAIQQNATKRPPVFRHFSLLQVSSNAARPASTQSFVQSLASSFEKIAQEQNESEAKLRTEFGEQLESLMARHRQLIEEQERLNKTMEDVQNLNQRLKDADKHATNVISGVAEQSRGLRDFLTATWKDAESTLLTRGPINADGEDTSKLKSAGGKQILVAVSPRSTDNQ